MTVYNQPWNRMPFLFSKPLVFGFSCCRSVSCSLRKRCYSFSLLHLYLCDKHFFVTQILCHLLLLNPYFLGDFFVTMRWLRQFLPNGSWIIKKGKGNGIPNLLLFSLLFSGIYLEHPSEDQREIPKKYQRWRYRWDLKVTALKRTLAQSQADFFVFKRILSRHSSCYFVTLGPLTASSRRVLLWMGLPFHFLAAFVLLCWHHQGFNRRTL